MHTTRCTLALYPLLMDDAAVAPHRFATPLRHMTPTFCKPFAVIAGSVLPRLIYAPHCPDALPLPTYNRIVGLRFITVGCG